jgi:hypothetical protein
MRRSTRNIFLALVGSAGLLTCCVSSCIDFQDEVEKDKDGQVRRDQQGHVVTHRRYYYRPWFGWGGGYGGGYGWGGGYGGSSYTPVRTGTVTTGGGGSRSTSTSTSTSRGGFGGTGHATAGS